MLLLKGILKFWKCFFLKCSRFTIRVLYNLTCWHFVLSSVSCSSYFVFAPTTQCQISKAACRLGTSGTMYWIQTWRDVDSNPFSAINGRIKTLKSDWFVAQPMLMPHVHRLFIWPCEASVKVHGFLRELRERWYLWVGDWKRKDLVKPQYTRWNFTESLNTLPPPVVDNQVLYRQTGVTQM